MKKRLLTELSALLFVALAASLWSPSAAGAQDIKLPIVEALSAGDTARAIDLLNREIEVDKSYYLNYYILGNIYYNRQEYDKAREYLTLAVDRKSKHFESAYFLGRTLIVLGELDEAEKVLQQGLKKSKKMKAQFENGIGLLNIARGDHQEADRAFRRALAESETAEAKRIKDLETERLEDSVRQYLIDSVRSAFARDNAEFHIHLGDVNFNQGVPSLAIIEYEKALAVDTGSMEVYYHWAEACLEMKDYGCAIDKLKIVLQKDSTHALAWMRAGGIYFKAGLSTRTRDERKARFMDAIGAYKRYLELSGAVPDSSSVRVFFELAMAYANVGGAEEAAGFFDNVLSIPYVPRDIYFHYGKALWGIQDFEKSGEMLQKHLEWVKDPDNAEASKVNDYELYQYLGDAYYYRENKDFASAAQYYLKSLEERPEQKRLTYNTAVCYHRIEELGPALDYYQRRIDLGIDSTKDAGIFKNAGYCALSIANSGADEEEEEGLDEEEGEDLGDGGIDPNVNYYEVAAGYMEQYMALEPDDVKVLLLLGNTFLYQLADCTNGVKYYKRLLEVEPGNCDAKKALGYAYFGGVCTKNYTRALGYLQDAYTCVSGSGGACSDVDLVLWIAQCYHLRAVEQSKDKSASSADFKSANEWYTKCLKCDSTNPECKKGRDDTSFEF